jgi:hypothetical protein
MTANGQVQIIIPSQSGSARTIHLGQSQFSVLVSTFVILTIWGICSTSLLIYVLVFTKAPAPIVHADSTVASSTTDITALHKPSVFGTEIDVKNVRLHTAESATQIEFSFQNLRPGTNTQGNFWISATFTDYTGKSYHAISTNAAGIDKQGIAKNPTRAGNFSFARQWTHTTTLLGSIPNNATLSKVVFGVQLSESTEQHTKAFEASSVVRR